MAAQGKTSIYNEDFVKAWMAAFRRGENQTWLAKQLNMSRAGVSNRGDRLRMKGVDLPKLNAHRLDVGVLNQIIHDMTKEVS